MEQTFDEIYEAVKQDVTDGVTSYMRIVYELCLEVKHNAAEGPNLTPTDGQNLPFSDYIRQAEEVLAQLRDAIWQLGTVLPIAQYTGQNEEKVEESSYEAEAEEACEAQSRLLYNQLKADHYSNWLEVANCSMATRGHLEEAARLCAKITNNDYYRESIANAIANHHAADDEALLPLCDSKYYSIWLIAAQSKHAGKKTLARLAHKCAKINNSDRYRDAISKTLAEHANANDDTLLPLCASGYYTVWLTVAGSKRAGDKTLGRLARECAGIGNSNRYAESIARALANNCNSTDKTLLPLCESNFFSVWEITAKSQYAGERTLSRLATMCAGARSTSIYIDRTAKAIAHHPNCTIDILALMAGARSEEVSHIAHERMRDMSRS